METKVHLRVGRVELDCEGSEDFVKQELPKILEAIAKFQDVSDLETRAKSKNPDAKAIKLTTGSIAHTLGGSTGPDLVLAAVAKLTFVDEQPEFSRADLLAEMKKATGRFKATFTKNLSQYLKTLIKNDKLREVASDRYSASTTSIADWKAKLFA